MIYKYLFDWFCVCIIENNLDILNGIVKWYVLTYVYMYICVYVCVCVFCTYFVSVTRTDVYMYIRIYVMCIRAHFVILYIMCICLYVYTYIYITPTYFVIYVCVFTINMWYERIYLHETVCSVSLSPDTYTYSQAFTSKHYLIFRGC